MLVSLRLGVVVSPVSRPGSCSKYKMGPLYAKHRGILLGVKQDGDGCKLVPYNCAHLGMQLAYAA